MSNLVKVTLSVVVLVTSLSTPVRASITWRITKPPEMDSATIDLGLRLVDPSKEPGVDDLDDTNSKLFRITKIRRNGHLTDEQRISEKIRRIAVFINGEAKQDNGKSIPNTAANSIDADGYAVEWKRYTRGDLKGLFRPEITFSKRIDGRRRAVSRAEWRDRTGERDAIEGTFGFTFGGQWGFFEDLPASGFDSVGNPSTAFFGVGSGDDLLAHSLVDILPGDSVTSILDRLLMHSDLGSFGVFRKDPLKLGFDLKYHDPFVTFQVTDPALTTEGFVASPSVPEPSTLFVFLIGCGCVAVARAWRIRKKAIVGSFASR